MGITEFLAEHFTAFIGWAGYTGVFVLMTLESMIAPVPSEAVMPFAGFLIAEQKFTWEGVVFFSTLGSIAGSLLSYIIGYYGGRPVVEIFGKYLFLNIHHLEMTERFFGKYGEITIFISRFIPVVRHLISIPAGVGKMNLLTFSIYTIIGAGLWNWILTYAGFALRSNWAEVMKYHKGIDIAIVLILVAAMGYVFYHLYQQSKRNTIETRLPEED